MKKVILFQLLLAFFVFTKSRAQSSIHSFTALTIDSNVVNLSSYLGKKILIVNTASYCGYTYQYSLLQQLYQTYNQYNFEILGFPCNNFGAQEPGTNSNISDFCTNNYSITFQMMDKVNIVAGDTSQIYKWLQHSQLNGVNSAAVDWNFNKFLINESGNWVNHFSSTTSPMDTLITTWIMSPSSIVSTGINFLEIENGIELISSNPASNTIDISVKNNLTQPLTFNLFSIDGKLIRKLHEKTTLQPEKLSFNISDLTAGIFILKATNGSAQKVIRIAVIK